MPLSKLHQLRPVQLQLSELQMHARQLFTRLLQKEVASQLCKLIYLVNGLYLLTVA